MKNKIWIFAFVLLLAGCGTSSFTSVNQIENRAYLQLEGNFLGTELIIDDKAPIAITKESVKSFEYDGREVVRFPLTTGSHKIKVMRQNTALVNRTIYVSNSNTFEVIVP